MATVAQDARRITSTRAQANRALGSAGLYLVVGALSVVSMFPFVWTFLSSGKEVSEFFQIPPLIIILMVGKLLFIKSIASESARNLCLQT